MESVSNEPAPRNAVQDGLGAALAIAVGMLGGRGIAPTPEVAAAFGLPVSHEAVCRWRREGLLPFRETRIGDRYYVSAADLAVALLPARVTAVAGVDDVDDSTPPRRGPGRPRKRPVMLEGGRRDG